MKKSIIGGDSTEERKEEEKLWKSLYVRKIAIIGIAVGRGEWEGMQGGRLRMRERQEER